MCKNVKCKLFIVLTIVIVLVGMVLLGTVGVNKSIDFNGSKQVVVSVDQNVNGAGEKTKDAVISYFNENGLKLEGYATQSADDGAKYIFKTNCDVKGIESSLLAYIENAVNDGDREFDVSAFEVSKSYNQNIPVAVIGIAIAVSLFFIYEIIVNKIKTAFTVLVTSVVSGLIYVSLLTITRTPSIPYFAITLCLSVIFATVFSVVICERFNLIKKLDNANKLSGTEVAECGIKQSKTRLLVSLVAIIVASITFMIFGGYNLFFGIQLLICGISALYSSSIILPIIYSALNK